MSGPFDRETLAVLGGIGAAFLFAWTRLRDAFPARRADAVAINVKLDELRRVVDRRLDDFDARQRAMEIDLAHIKGRMRGPAE